MCGCGAQGRAQLRALTRVRPVRLVLAVDADARRAEAYAREMSGEMGIDVRAAEDLAGAALQDVPAAGVVYERAVAEGRGRRLALA